MRFPVITGNGFTKFVKKAFYWPIKKFAGAVTYGLEVPQGFWKAKAGNLDKLKANPLISLKKAAGYPIRFPLVLFVISPFFVNPILKLSHLIFGKPKKSVLDEGKEPESVKAKNPRPVIKTQQPVSVMQPSRYNSSVPIQRENLLDMYKAKHSAPAMMPLNQDSSRAYIQSSASPAMMPMNNAPLRTYMPSSAAPAMMPSNNEPVRTYMPSASGIVINPNVVMQENAKANEAFLKEDNAEKKAMGHID